jgi:predicted metal-dependent hydrolase
MQNFENVPPLTEQELQELKRRAKLIFEQRAAHYAPLLGVTYSKITVRSQRTRWGSCSSNGNLSFNCLLLLAPDEVLDCIVVHELCHRKEMNHSERFYREVLRVFPEYQKHHAWLKQNGEGLIRRLPQK